MGRAIETEAFGQLEQMREKMGNVLIIEDEKGITNFVKKGLETHGFRVDVAEDGKSGEFLAMTRPYDAIVIDIMLPDKDGVGILRKMRKDDVPKKAKENPNFVTPVIMLTAKRDLETKSAAFESGADDYLTKPFELEELMLRLKSLMKRCKVKTDNDRGLIEFSDLKLDLGTCKAKRRKREIKLTRKEFELLKYFMMNKKMVLRRDDILENVWGYRHESLTNTIETHVRFLRKKIDDGFRPKLIHTVHGIGYKLDTEA